jgi:hypothetical protein
MGQLAAAVAMWAAIALVGAVVLKLLLPMADSAWMVRMHQ